MFIANQIMNYYYLGEKFYGMYHYVQGLRPDAPWEQRMYQYLNYIYIGYYYIYKPIRYLIDVKKNVRLNKQDFSDWVII